MEKKKKIGNIIINIILGIAMIFCIMLIVFKVTFIEVIVNGSSMNPNIQDGAKGYMIKVNKNSKIARFDVVVSKYYKDDYFIIKRVLGLPGEEIRLEDNILYVNNEIVEQSFSFISKQDNFENTQWTLNENEYLLVGDNRANTVEPVVENINNILAKNGFSYANYDIHSSKCKSASDYSSCPIESYKWYWFKKGMK